MNSLRTQTSATRRPDRYLTVRADPQTKHLHLQVGERDRTLCATKIITPEWQERPAEHWDRKSARCKLCAGVYRFNIPMAQLWGER